MKEYTIEVYSPDVYILKARNKAEAQEKALAKWQKIHKTWIAPVVEVTEEDGVRIGFWESLDSAIDDYKEKAL
jgi:hypothetical protein